MNADLAGRVTAIMGPSGAGKTSLLEAIVGLRPRARGRVAIDGHVLLDTAARIRLAPEARRLGYVPQDAGLFPHLTALENVRFGAHGDTRRVEDALDVLELRAVLSRYPVSLSGGEKQRVALARALASNPRALLLDEPLAALDVALRERIVPYLLRIRDEWRVPMLYVTHNVGEALALGDDLLLLSEGDVEAHGPPLELLGSPGLFRAAEAGIENLLQGRVVGHDEAGGITRLELEGGLPLSVGLVPERAAGSVVTVAIRAEDVLVMMEPASRLSARNVFPARVLATTRTGNDVTLRCALERGEPWLVRLTPSAVVALGVAVGETAWLAVKSHSIRVV